LSATASAGGPGQRLRVLILGLGNLLLRDEGVGIHAVRRFARDYRVSPQVALLDGGTAGMQLVAPIAEAEHLIVIDAVDTGRPPGTVVVLRDEDVPVFFGRSHLSPHQVGLSDVIAVCRLAEGAPASITVLGVEPANLEPGLDLTPPVAAALPRLLRQLIAELERLGHPAIALED
jgi:hydrogenase maturation protease